MIPKTVGLIGTPIWVFLMWFCSRDQKLLHTELVCGEQVQRYNWTFAFITVLPIIIWAGFRSGYGYADTNAYIWIYSNMPTNSSGLARYLVKNDKDPGFSIFVFLVKILLGKSYTPFLLILAIFQCIAVCSLFRKYSPDFVFSIFLFVASTDYFSWIFNGLRQFTAVCIIISAFPLLMKKKYVWYFLLVGLAATFHLSAIIMIPISIASLGKPWNRRTLIGIIIAVFALTMTNQFTSLLGDATEDTQYAGQVADWALSGDDGANPIRVLVYSIPTILALIGRKRLEMEDNKVINICINMSIFSTALWLIALVTNGISMGRMPIYAGLFNYILLPYEVNLMFEKKSISFMYWSCIVLYLLYSYYQLHVTWGVI